jgi:preprotein translocase subunit SecD
MNNLLKVLFLLFIPMLSFSQRNDDGVYLEIEEVRCSYNKLRLANTNTFVCILDNPIITVDDFKEVGPFEVDTKNNIRAFSIMMSAEGSKKLATITRLYSGKNLAFVVNNKVVCLMKVNGEITSGKFTVTEDISHSSLKYVHKKIKESIDL